MSSPPSPLTEVLTSSDMSANSSNCKNLENSCLPLTSLRMVGGLGSRTLSRVKTTPVINSGEYFGVKSG